MLVAECFVGWHFIDGKSTLFMAGIFLGEQLTVQQIGGAALVMAGVLSLTLK